MSATDSEPATCPVNHDYDPLAPAAVADPYPGWAALHEGCPVFFAPATNHHVAVSYDSVAAILRNSQAFLSAPAFPGMGPPPADLRDVLPNGFPSAQEALINSDAPRHIHRRRLVNQAFTNPKVDAMEPMVARIVRERMDAIRGAGRAELMSEFCELVPNHRIAAVLGLDETTMVPQIMQWLQDGMVLSSPTATEQERRGPAERQADFARQCRAWIADRRERPREDLISHLVAAEIEIDGGRRRLDDGELIPIIFELVLAGNITVFQAIGHTVLRLLQHPATMARVRADHGLIPSVVEETLRHHSPSNGMLRMAAVDTVIGETTVPSGSVIQPLWIAANHDPTVFPNPERFDIDRVNASDHISFGMGRHFCLGQRLARMELRLALEEVLTLDGLRLDGDDAIAYAPHPMLHPLVKLDVAWDV